MVLEFFFLNFNHRESAADTHRLHVLRPVYFFLKFLRDEKEKIEASFLDQESQEPLQQGRRILAQGGMDHGLLLGHRNKGMRQDTIERLALARDIRNLLESLLTGQYFFFGLRCIKKGFRVLSGDRD